MIRSRRAFVAEAAVLTAAGGTLLGSCATATDQKPNEDDATRVRFEVYPIGKVEKIEGRREFACSTSTPTACWDWTNGRT